MSNKTLLQTNNINLQEVSQTIQNLPIINPWEEESNSINPGNESIIIPAYTDKEITVNPVSEYFEECGTYVSWNNETFTVNTRNSSYPFRGSFMWQAVPAQS